MRLILALLLLPHLAHADIVQPDIADLFGSPLAGTAWQFTEINDLRRPMATPMFLTFQTNGSATGNTGCNAFHANYEGPNGGLTFGPIYISRNTCSEALTSLQDYTLDTLQQVTDFTLSDDGQTLTLTTPDGGILILQPTE
ncbi:MAG: META domain-containing protein [Paracoccaceae bacterium]